MNDVVIPQVQEQRLNDMIQDVNKVVLGKQATGGEYLAMLHVLLAKALSNCPKKLEKAFISNLQRETRNQRIAQSKEKPNAG